MAQVSRSGERHRPALSLSITHDQDIARLPISFSSLCLAGLTWALAMCLLLDRLVCYLKRLGFPRLKWFVLRVSLVVQWLRLSACKAEVLGSIPSQGTRFHRLQLKRFCMPQ